MSDQLSDLLGGVFAGKKPKLDKTPAECVACRSLQKRVAYTEKLLGRILTRMVKNGACNATAAKSWIAKSRQEAGS